MSSNKSNLEQHLLGGCVESLEAKLKLNESFGFPCNSSIEEDLFLSLPDEYNRFESYCKTARTLMGVVDKEFDVETNCIKIYYRYYIVAYRGKYIVQVVQWNGGNESISTGSFNDYLDALLFLEEIVFN